MYVRKKYENPYLFYRDDIFDTKSLTFAITVSNFTSQTSIRYNSVFSSASRQIQAIQSQKRG